MKLYKLTDENGQTYGGCQWGENITHGEDELLEGEGPLCSGHWYHAYQDTILAVLMNPAHAKFENPRLWAAEANIGREKPDKVGCKSLTTLREVPLPDITITQRQAFAILAALEVYDGLKFVAWAEKWLSGEDRSAATAATVSATVSAAAWAARAAAGAAAWAARAAAGAAWAAVEAAPRELDLTVIIKKVMEEF